MAAPPNIYFMYPDFAEPVGGMKVAYRHVDLLNELGYRAWIVHHQRGFRCTWFQNRTPVTSTQELHVRRHDLFVLPEIFDPQRARAYPGIKRVIFNQNAYYTFLQHPWRPNALDTPYLSPDLLGVIVVSTDNRDYLAHAFPNLRLFRYCLSIDPQLFAPRFPKRKLIAFMPRKNMSDLGQVLNILKFRGVLCEYALRPIHGMSWEQVAGVLQDAEIFLSSGTAEGCPLPPLEALACGCLVIGYHGQGGREYLLPEWSFPIEQGDILEYARTVERVVRGLDQDPEPLRDMARRASRFVLDTYSEERERAAVAAIWQELTAGL